MDYLGGLYHVVGVLRERGEKTHLLRYELDRLNDAIERGDDLTSFADWLITSRREPRFGPLDDEPMTQDGAEEGIVRGRVA